MEKRTIGHVIGSTSLVLAIFIWVEMLGFATWAERYLNDFTFAALFFGSIILSLAAGLISSRRWLLVIVIPVAVWGYVVVRGH
jgi:hypothetical protein